MRKRERGDMDLAQTINSRPPTERAFRSRVREVGAALDAQVQQDEVLFAMTVLADMHPEELVEIVRSRRERQAAS